jgi:hypothetical protein
MSSQAMNAIWFCGSERDASRQTIVFVDGRHCPPTKMLRLVGDGVGDGLGVVGAVGDEWSWHPPSNARTRLVQRRR